MGFAAKGLIYLTVGYIALRIAFGEDPGEEADNGGALQIIAQGTGGMLLLWAIAVGLAGLTLWQALVAVVRSGTAAQRAGAAARAVTCAVLTTAIATFLLGRGAPESQDGQSKELTAQLMELPFGRWIVGIIGAVVVAVGVHQVWKALTRRFTHELALGGTRRPTRRAVVMTGTLGITTHGLVLGMAGVFFVQAALAFDEERAEGLDGTLRAFSETAAGPYALVAVAVGVVLYGAYCFCQARWQRT
ncbi:DUF1206 domain-containing protein [Nocardiopsis sp. MG754419]|nr:DUF1206 domain-containing protein [Nocardiopsis sp. MG754419]